MIFIFFLTGLAFGSFANVLIYRLPKKLSIIYPSSFCPLCNTTIKWYDNIPILSYFLLKGRCRYCGGKISIVYPLIELSCGVLLTLLFIKFGFFSLIFFSLFFILLVISVIDIKTTEIPDPLSYYLILSGIMFSTFNPLLGNEIFVRVANSLLGGIAGFLLFYLISYLGEKIFKKPVLGGGDVKLMSGIGCYLGVYPIFSILFVSSLLAMLYVVILSIIKRDKLWGKYVQFAPFISLATFIITVFNADSKIIKILSLL